MKAFGVKMSANVDFGYSITKANNLRQFNADAVVSYKSRRWVVSANYRQVRSIQDEVDPIRRIEGGINGDYTFNSGVFLGARISFPFKHRAEPGPSYYRYRRCRLLLCAEQSVVLETYLPDRLLTWKTFSKPGRSTGRAHSGAPKPGGCAGHGSEPL